MIEVQPVDRIRAAIENKTGPGRRDGNGWSFKCPAHSDRNPSLSLGENTEHHALLYCHSGCDTDTILQAIGFTRRDLYPVRDDDRRQDPVVATYKYVDETGTLLYEVERTASKRFRQRRPDPDNPGKWLYKLDNTRRVLYRLPYVLEAAREGQTVYVVEGEKDVHSVMARGAVATCNPGGAGKWRPEYNDALRGAHVVVIIDKDPEGQGLRHGRQVARALMPGCASVIMVQPGAGKDTTDHLTAGLELENMQIVPINAPDADPKAAPGPDEPVDDLLPAPVSPAETPGDDRRNRIRLTAASAFEIKPVLWVWADRIPLGEITLVPGREGVGKSTFLAWMAAAITNGNLPGIYHNEPRAVLYAATEDAWGYTIAPRMLAAGANLDLVYRIDVMEDDGPTGLNLPRDCRYLPDVAAEVKAAVLMCDPILSMVDERVNTNYAGELRKALTPLKTALEHANMSGIGLVHFNKTVDVDVMSRIAGSRAWGEVARAVIAIARDHETEDGTYTCVVDQIKNNLGRTDLAKLTYTLDSVTLETKTGPDAHVARIRWTGETDTGAEEILSRKPSRNPATGSANIDAIMEHLEGLGQASSPREIADACELSRDTTKKILLRLANAGTIDRVGTGLYITKRSQPGTTVGDSVDWRNASTLRGRGSRVDPLLSLSPHTHQVRGGAGTEEGGKAVPGDEPGTGTRIGEMPSPQLVPARSCRRCHAPFVPGDESQTLCDQCLNGV